MKTRQKMTGLVFAVLIALSSFIILAGCSKEWKVTFDYNYEGAPENTVSVLKDGEKVSKPAEDPTRSGFVFEGWYKDAAGGEAYGFDTPVTENITIYAKWRQEDVNPPDPEIKGSEYIIKHEEGSKVTYVFEAENTNIGKQKGVGYSGPGDLVVSAQQPDISGAGVIGYLYKKGLSISFVIISDRDVEDATLSMRINAEYMNMIINPESYLIRVDQVSDQELETTKDGGSWGDWDTEFLPYYEPAYCLEEWDCGEIQINCWELDEPQPYENFLLTTRLKLFKGATSISLITNNDEVPRSVGGDVLGTMGAIAPMVDCIAISTTAQIGAYRPADNYTGNAKNACWIDYDHKFF